MDGASWGNPGPEGIRGVLVSSKDVLLLVFSKNMGICDSNVAEVLAISKGLGLFSRRRYNRSLIIEKSTSNASACVSNQKVNHWIFQFHFNEIRELAASFNAILSYEVRSANSTADVLARQWVDRVYPCGYGLCNWDLGVVQHSLHSHSSFLFVFCSALYFAFRLRKVSLPFKTVMR